MFSNLGLTPSQLAKLAALFEARCARENLAADEDRTFLAGEMVALYQNGFETAESMNAELDKLRLWSRSV